MCAQQLQGYRPRRRLCCNGYHQWARADADLKAATKGDNLETLRNALAIAEAAGVAKKDVDEARKMLDRMDKAAVAEADLKAATKGKDAESLRNALATARSSGVAEKSIAHAQEILANMMEMTNANLSELSLYQSSWSQQIKNRESYKGGSTNCATTTYF